MAKDGWTDREAHGAILTSLDVPPTTPMNDHTLKTQPTQPTHHSNQPTPPRKTHSAWLRWPPEWAEHLRILRVLDSDTVFLHGQERELRLLAGRYSPNRSLMVSWLYVIWNWLTC